MELEKAAKKVKSFEGNNLAGTLSDIEIRFRGANRVRSEQLRKKFHLGSGFISSALELKRAAAQINVMIHAVGILLALPHILDDDEHIEYLSLGAGNTGRQFDLETDKRVAEFKFINWQGGPEVIRQNSLFKDFYSLVEYDSPKMRCLYVLGKKIPLRFFSGNRTLKSVLSRNNKLEREFFAKYGDKFKVVCEYYAFHKDKVQIIDVLNILPEMSYGEKT